MINFEIPPDEFLKLMSMFQQSMIQPAVRHASGNTSPMYQALMERKKRQAAQQGSGLQAGLMGGGAASPDQSGLGGTGFGMTMAP